MSAQGYDGGPQQPQQAYVLGPEMPSISTISHGATIVHLAFDDYSIANMDTVVIMDLLKASRSMLPSSSSTVLLLKANTILPNNKYV